MLPVRDHNPAGRTPVVTYALIFANVAIFLATLPYFEQPRALAALFGAWAIVPAEISAGHGWHTLLSSMFLHGGWMHLLGNMLFLHVFGDNLEDRLGHGGFAGFYLVSGLGAGWMQVLADPGSGIPVVGASGAIAGVMGGYLLLFPRARIDVFMLLFLIPVPAWLMLGAWFGLQVVNGLTAVPGAGGVAHWAHAGGFAVGVLLVLPVWLRLGGPRFWRRTHGHPDHPEARYRVIPTRVPHVRRDATRPTRRSGVPKAGRRRL